MELSSSEMKTIQHQYDALAKKVLKGEARSCYRELSKRAALEVNFLEMSEAELSQLYTLDKYERSDTFLLRRAIRRVLHDTIPAGFSMQGTFGYEMDLSKLSDREKEFAKEQIAEFKKHYALFQFGKYYRITSPYCNHDFTAWEYAAKDGTEAMLAVVFTDLHGNPAPLRVRWKGLETDRQYAVWCDGIKLGVLSGAALMNAGILLPVPKENYDSCQFYICAE